MKPHSPNTIAFFKPFGVLSQFTPEGGHPALDGFGLPKDVYPIGRLDHDSEGLLLLTADRRLKTLLSDPKFDHPKTYWVQVEGTVSPNHLQQLENGLLLKDGFTRPARAQQIPPPEVPPRDPPIRVRKSIPDSWIELTITEGKNRQVRRMTAAVGLPTLRLLRVRQGGLFLFDLALQPGMWKEVYIRSQKVDNTGVR